MTNGALATTGKNDDRGPAVITTPDQYRDALERWQQHYNILTPFTNVSGIAPSFGIIASVIKINPDPAAGEVYSGFTESGAKAMPFLKGEKGKPSEELAIAKVGLRKLAECGGISTHTERTDPRTLAHYWEFRAVVTYRGIDGTLITREATFEWDLRDGSDRLKGWTPNQITEGRKNGLRSCEARAINAAIRECGCGIKQKYTRAELERPFVVIRVGFQPDMSDPAVKQAVTLRALEGTSTLYPTQRRDLPPASGGDVIEGTLVTEPRQAGSGATAAASAPPAGATPDPNQPPTPDAVRIVKVESKSGETKGKKWTRFVIIDDRGEEHSTFDAKLADAAKAFIEPKTWVEIDEETDGPYRNLVQIAPAQPSLLPDATKL
jgi:hypothetical protein